MRQSRTRKKLPRGVQAMDIDTDRRSTDRLSGMYDRAYNDVRDSGDGQGGGISSHGYDFSGNAGGTESGGSSFDNGCVDCQQNLYEIHV